MVVISRWSWSEQVKQLVLVSEFEALEVGVAGVASVEGPEELQVVLALIRRC